MCDSKPSVFSLIPVLGFAVLVGIRRDYLALEHYCLNVEVIILAYRKKPYVFRTIFPVRLCTPALFAFPRDSILRQKILLPDAMNGCRAPPVAADVDRGRGFEYSHNLRQPRVKPCGVFIERSLAKRGVVKTLREVVRRICKHQIHRTIRQFWQHVKNILTEHAVV